MGNKPIKNIEIPFERIYLEEIKGSQDKIKKAIKKVEGEFKK